MKPIPVIRCAFIIIFCLMSLRVVDGLCLAVTFPITYEGTLHLEASYAEGSCEGDAKMKITLFANGSLTETTDVIIMVPGPNHTACNIDSLDRLGQPWRKHEGTHDKVGVFSVNIGPAPVAGTFDDNVITGTGTGSDGFMAETYTFTLYAEGTGTAPSITLEPSDYPNFQASVLMGEGFIIRIRKEDGVRDAEGNWKLNWSKLAFTTSGLDNSLHFIKTVASQQIVGASVDEKEVRFHVRPDPSKFMADHNVFDVKFNGDQLLGFRICDTTGRCGESQYTVYFGPMIFTGEKIGEQCLLGPHSSIDKYYDSFYIDWIAIANVGLPSETAKIYALLQNSKGENMFFVTWGRFSQYHGIPSMENIELVCPYAKFKTPFVCIEDYKTLSFEVEAGFASGPVTFIVAIWDQPANLLKYDFTVFDLCK